MGYSGGAAMVERKVYVEEVPTFSLMIGETKTITYDATPTQSISITTS